jgi:hypothetical protein
LALTPESADSGKQAQWQAFLSRSRLAKPGIELLEVIGVLGGFLVPVIHSLETSEPFDQRWLPQGP